MEEKATFYSATYDSAGSGSCAPCSPCYPDTPNEDGSQCAPCNPCVPNQRGPGGIQCAPCSPCYPDQGAPSFSAENSIRSSEGCYISSACINSRGLPDDCYELQILRAFRDKRCRFDKDFEKLTKEYYEFAPKVVASIDDETKKEEIYAELYTSLVKPCVAYLLANEETKAIAHYKDVVFALKEKYGA